jgi:predicted N-acyltransferase
MLVDAGVSERVEERRRHDGYYLTSQTLAMGSLITEGDHLYLDRSRDWRQALGAMLDAVAGVQKQSGTSTLVLRDVPDADAELGEYLRDAGFVKVGLPDSHVLDVDFATDEEFLAGLPHKARYHQRRNVLPFDPVVSLEVRRGGPGAVTAEELDHFYRLYRNVHARGLELNTFLLPRRLFDEIAESPEWELLLLHACDGNGRPAQPDPVAFGAALVAHDLYCPVLIGLDYEFVSSHAIYRQMLRGSVRRAIARRCRSVQWGMGARLEKRRFGARAERRSAWVQAADHYSAEVLEQLSAEARAAEADGNRPRPHSESAREPECRRR